MRMTLTALVRSIAFLALGSSILAIGVSRATPRTARRLHPAPQRFYGINGSVFDPPQSGNFLLDAATGELKGGEFTRAVALDFASSAPWSDETGDTWMLGRLAHWSGESESKQFEGAGLYGVTLSSGRTSGELGVGPIVSGRACWLPGRADRVVFPAGDGKLYVQDFNLEGDGPESAPRQISWACATPGVGGVTLADPVCSGLPELGGRIFVTLSFETVVHGVHRLTPGDIWWLSLDSEGRSIVAAGPLLEHVEGARALAAPQRRLPNLSQTVDGEFVMANLERPGDGKPWRLALTPVDFEPSTGAPVARSSERQTFDDECAVTSPAFSPDGRYVYQVSRSRRAGGGLVSRHDVRRSLTKGEPDEPVMALSGLDRRR